MTVLTMRSRLTEADVRALVRGANEDERAAAAHKIAKAIDYAELDGEERAHAEGILRIIAADAAERVRRALSVALRQSPKLPPDVARRLAEDVDSIALPILEHSPALSDRDLVEILRAAPPVRQFAIAGRPRLSREVAAAIASHAAPPAVERALANDNAEFDEDALRTVLERMGEEEAVTAAMARRSKLPVTVVEKLVALVSGAVFDHLVNTHALPPQLAIDIAAGARERATLDLIEQATMQSDVRRFVQQLNLHGRLTPSFIMRALCLGHIAFVEHAFAELGGFDHRRAWMLLHDAGPHGLRTLFDRSGLPTKLYPAFRAGIELYHQLQAEGRTDDRAALRQRMIERALTMFRSVPRDDLDYLLDKLDAVGGIPERMTL